MYCEICTELTMTSTTKLCNGCWGLDYQLSGLIRRNPTLAKKWLKEQLTLINEKTDEQPMQLIARQQLEQIKVTPTGRWFGPDAYEKLELLITGLLIDQKEAGL